MGWITTGQQIEHILQGVAGRGWPVPELGWMADEAGLLRLWESNGWPMQPRAGCGAIGVGGGLVAWVSRYNRELWALIAVAEWDGVATWRDRSNPAPDAVTLWNARDYGATPKAGPIKPGDWIAWQNGRKGGCRLAIAETVLNTGAALSARVTPAGLIVPAIGQRWFAIRGRDDACAWFWKHGETEFKHYMVMSTKLYHKQRKLVGDAAVGPRQPTVPGKPERPMPVDHARIVAQCQDVVRMAQSAVRGAFQQFGRDSVEFQGATATFNEAAAKLAAAEAAWQAELLN